MGVRIGPSTVDSNSDLMDIVISGSLAGNATLMNDMEVDNMSWSNTSTSTSPITSHYAQYEIVWTGEVLFRVVTIIIVMVLTIVGNITLILIITCHPAERRKRVNIFLVNLALGDLMVCFFTMTTEILFVAFGEWVLGAAACKIIVYGQIVTLSSAVFLLTAMSIDRYQVLVQPLRSLTGKPRIWKKVASAWALSFIVAVPQLFIFLQTDEGNHIDGSIKHLCRSQGYTAKWQRKVYFTYLTSYILVLPTIIMSFCYINIIRVVWKRTDSDTDKESIKMSFHFRRKATNSQEAHNGLHQSNRQRTLGGNIGESVKSSSNSQAQNRLRLPKKLINSSKRNVVKMTLSVIVGFLICWTPYFVVSLARIYSDYRLNLKVGLAVAEVMALVHSAMNPILYVIFCTRHAKAAILRMTRCLHSKPHLDGQPMGDEGTSDDDTTWTDSRRFNSISIVRKGRLGACCTEVFHKVQTCICPCTKALKSGKGARSLDMGFYQELVPNRTGVGARPGCTEAVLIVSEAPNSDTEVMEFEGRGYGQGLERRQTLSYVMANPNIIDNTAQDSVSAV